MVPLPTSIHPLKPSQMSSLSWGFHHPRPTPEAVAPRTMLPAFYLLLYCRQPLSQPNWRYLTVLFICVCYDALVLDSMKPQMHVIPPVAFCSISSGSSVLWLWHMHSTLQLTGLGAEAWNVGSDSRLRVDDARPSQGLGASPAQQASETDNDKPTQCVCIGWCFSFLGLPL